MKIYTKKGDSGESALYGGGRFSKDSIIFDVLGTLDELNASLGFVGTTNIKALREIVLTIQNDLFLLGSYIANDKTSIDDFASFSEKTVNIENTIDELDSELEELRNFILPGGCREALHFHLSRAICRRLERLLVTYAGEENVKDDKIKYVLEYINRLSDLLFVLARYSNMSRGVTDTIWKIENN